MATRGFRVTVPYTERHHDYPQGRPFEAQFEIQAPDWLSALREAVQRVQAGGDFHSWHCEVAPDRVEVTELAGGKRFRITDLLAEEAPGAALAPLPARQAELPYPELIRLLTGDVHPATTVGRALELAMKAVDAEAGSVLVREPKKKDLVFLEVRGEKSEELKRFRLKLGQGIAGWCALHGQTLAVSDAARDERFYDRISKQLGVPTRSVICAPLRVGGAKKAAGVLEVLNRRGTPQFVREEILFVEAVARVIALVMAAGR